MALMLGRIHPLLSPKSAICVFTPYILRDPGKIS